MFDKHGLSPKVGLVRPKPNLVGLGRLKAQQFLFLFLKKMGWIEGPTYTT